MEIVEVISLKEQKEFLNFPVQLYANDSSFIRHLDDDINAVFDKSRNRFLAFGEAKRWLLQDAGRTVGKIAAFYHTEKPEKPFVGMGFFDCINNQSAANLLFQQAMDWLKSKRFSSALAPINFGDRDSYWGLMVQGFQNVSYRENYNPPYYQKLFENFGFKKDFEQTTSKLLRADFNLERFSKLASRVLSNPKYEFRHLDMKKKESFIKDFLYIYNKAWQSHEFFRPMSEEQVRKQLQLMAPIAPNKLNWFVYANGEPAGFFINVLNINPIFKAANGKFNLLTKLRFLFLKSQIKTIRGIVFGVIPEYHNLGLEVGMIMKMYEQLQTPPLRHIDSTELAWVGDFNPKMLSMFNSLGAKIAKVHYTYRIDF
ncbi:MAG: hypothetical protein M0R38_03530 [Bacteroidia bacterium]|nr:hypothetical protein [Bacteroidia bacterium]